MDLVDYDQKVFNQIKSEIEPLLNKPKDQAHQAHYLPISALKGDNLITPSKTMDWYSGKSLIEIIETLPLGVNTNALGIMQVQYVIRPQLENHHDYRGFAGKIKSGTFKPGDQITVFPSGQKTHIKAIERYGEPLEEVLENDNATFLLTDEVDASRGSVFVRQSEALLPPKKDQRYCLLDAKRTIGSRKKILVATRSANRFDKSRCHPFQSRFGQWRTVVRSGTSFE